MKDPDKALETALVVALSKARSILETAQKLKEFGAALPLKERNELQLLTRPIIPVVAAHPAMKGAGRTTFFGNGLYNLQSPDFTARDLLWLTFERGAGDAVKWLRKAAGVKSADVRIVLEVFGLKIASAITFANGVRLHPMVDIADAPNAASILRMFSKPPEFSPLMGIPPLALAVDILRVSGRAMGDEEGMDIRQTTQMADLMETVRALSVPDNLAPIGKSYWHYFIDLDYQRAQSGRMWTGPLHEIGIDHAYPTEVTADDVEMCNRYLKLPQDQRVKLHVGLNRLARAKHRQSAEDKAIDGAIALESILGDQTQKSEMTHKVAVRAALLLEEGTARQDVQSKVKRFYSLRSKVVHGSAADKDGRELADEGIKIAGRVVRKLIEIGRPLDHRGLDLGLWP